MEKNELQPQQNQNDDRQWKKSVLVVAHPDDEILWFSSIMDKVDAVILCFMGNRRVPERRNARFRVLDDYPQRNIYTLDINTSGAHGSVDWNSVIETSTGLEINKATARKAYQETYQRIEDELRSRRSIFYWIPPGNQESGGIMPEPMSAANKAVWGPWLSITVNSAVAAQLPTSP